MRRTDRSLSDRDDVDDLGRAPAITRRGTGRTDRSPGAQGNLGRRVRRPDPERCRDREYANPGDLAVNGFAQHLATSLRLHFRNRMALLYGYLFPVIYLGAFWVLYRYEKIPLLH